MACTRSDVARAIVVAIGLTVLFVQCSSLAHDGYVGLGRISPPRVPQRRKIGSRAAFRASTFHPPVSSEPERYTDTWIILPDGTREPMRIIHASRSQAEIGVARLRAAARHWHGQLALLVEDPALALIVRVREILHEENGFRMRMSVEEVIGAPEGFDRSMSIERRCGWNQPYMSFDEEGVYAPYAFYLHVGNEGVARVREFWAKRSPRMQRYTRQMRGLLRAQF